MKNRKNERGVISPALQKTATSIAGRIKRLEEAVRMAITFCREIVPYQRYLTVLPNDTLADELEKILNEK